MCGIVGFSGARSAAPILLDGLKRLEYRGYDSAGLAVLYEHQIRTAKAVGHLRHLCEMTHDGADLPGFCREVKSLGLLVKLDTNGSRPDTVRRLIEAELIDYVAMDVKNGRERYAETAGVPSLDLGPVEESVALLKEGRVDYEFRTTVVSQLHDEASLVSAAEWLRGAKAWYLQQFVDSGGCIRQGLTAYSEDALRALLKTVQTILPAARLRGV